MKIWVLGFPHVQTVDPRDPAGIPICFFTELAYNFCTVMAARGHEVIHVGTAGSKPPPGVEQVDVCTPEEWRILYGWSPVQIKSNADAYGEYRKRFAAKARQVFLDRGGDPYTSVICTLWGSDGATDNVPQFVCEYSIGYPHARAAYRVYQSHAWRHFNEGQDQNISGNHWYWQVIPMPIDLDLFGPVETEKDDYLLVQCRMTDDKGVELAVQVAKTANIPIILTGYGDGARFAALWPEGAKYLGPVSVGKRRELMRKARALLSPTRYVEPLGSVAIEAQASGCPVISTDWGGFTESIVHADADGKSGTGWRCSTFEEFLWAVRNVHKIDPRVCREWIARNHSFERVGSAYEDYFKAVLRVQGGGWTDPGPADVRVELPRAFRDYSMFRG